MKKTMMNMTEGSPTGLLLRFAVPMMIGNIFQQLYNLVDSVIVGQFVGANALASIGATSSVTFLFFALCNGIGSGGGIITSQFFGSGDEAKVKQCIVNTAYIMLVFPVLLGSLAFLLSSPILRLLGTPEKIFPDALVYTRIMCVGLVFVSVYNFISAMLRALGDSKTPLIFLIFACILNTLLDLVFVYILHLSVFGAGIATLISQFLSGVLCLLYAVKTNPYFRIRRQDLTFSRSMTARTIRLGVPLSLQFSMIAISCMALQRVVNSFGPVTVAAFTATSRIEQILHQPYQTFSAALSTYTGQNIGAHKSRRVLLGFRKGMLLMIVFTLAVLPCMQFFGRAITAVFVNDPQVIDLGGTALRISSLFYIFLGTIYIIRGLLSGAGDAFFALLNGIVEVIGRFSVPLFLTRIPAIGLWGIWWSVGIVWFLSGFTAFLRYRSFRRKIKDSLSE